MFCPGGALLFLACITQLLINTCMLQGELALVVSYRISQIAFLINKLSILHVLT